MENAFLIYLSYFFCNHIFKLVSPFFLKKIYPEMTIKDLIKYEKQSKKVKINLTAKKQ